MFRNLVLFSTILIAVSGCGTGNRSEVTAKLGDGTEAIVYLEEESVDGGKLLIVDYKRDKARRKEADVDNDVERIWESVRPEAEKRGFAEALIKYRQPNPDSEDSGTYTGLLFEAERIENGTWKLKRVN